MWGPFVLAAHTAEDFPFRIATDDGMRFPPASIPEDIDKTIVMDAIRDGRIQSCGLSNKLTESIVESAERIVAQMGTEPIATPLAKRVS